MNNAELIKQLESLYSAVVCDVLDAPTDERVIAAVRTVLKELHRSGEREIDSRQVGEHVMRALKQLDQVAYVRFASVYKSFKDIREFVQAIDEMNDPDHG